MENTMNYRTMLAAFCFVILFCILYTPSASALTKSYIVYLGSHSHGPDVTTAQLDAVRDSHHELLGSLLGSKEKARESIFYSYDRNINGFAAVLKDEDLEAIRSHPEVLAVFENRVRELHTTHSWNFMKLEQNNGDILSNSLWKTAEFGNDVIIANLDTGVWPESKSFSDEGYGPIPSRWRGNCHHSGGIRCNRKLIGARYYNRGFLAAGFSIERKMNNSRDFEGHGSHTLSTAGGNFVHGAQVYGALNGTVKGGAPKARLAVYKVCWPGGGCADADIVKSIDMAIHDRVDVISVSLGGNPKHYADDAISIGAFHAVQKGIAVVCSAGNFGEYGPGSVTNVSPWFFTVGAYSDDRSFETSVLLQNGKRLLGSSITKGLPKHTFYRLITGEQAKVSNATVYDAGACSSRTLDKKKVKGKILVCIRNVNTTRMESGRRALEAGAVGMILCNDGGNLTNVPSDQHLLPAVHLNYTDALTVFDYINSTSDPLAYITPTKLQYGKSTQAPQVAYFSSLGPNTITPEILKPDIIAPGVNIIAAFPDDENDPDEYGRTTPFAIFDGTSMSCPHVSGVVALLKSIHPSWSFAAIKSAIMTTATTRDNRMQEITVLSASQAVTKATPFGYGAGQVRPNNAAHPGLVYDLDSNDYLDLLCGLGYNKSMISHFSKSHKCPQNATVKAVGTKSSSLVLNFNYPSITVPNIQPGSSVTITRRLKSVSGAGQYRVRLRQPKGFSVCVTPRNLIFEKENDVKSYYLTITTKSNSSTSTEYSFGQVMWTDHRHFVSSPIVVSAA